MTGQHSGSRIAIDPSYLAELEKRCSDVVQRLVNLDYKHMTFDSAPPVGRALESFTGRWERSRGEIVQGMRDLTHAVRVIRESFESADSDLKASLNDRDQP